MIVRFIAPLMLPLILGACLAGDTNDPQTATPPPASPAEMTTVSQSPTSIEATPAPPTPSVTPAGTAEVLIGAPSADVCTHSEEPPIRGIFIMNADGTNIRQIEPEGLIEVWDPDWSPDGSQIAAAGYDGQDDGIFVMNADGTNVQRVTDGDGDSREPDWSPDGTRIVFVRQHIHPDGTHLYIVDRDGTNLRRLTSFPGFVAAPAWSPDGTRIAYASDRDSNYEIYVIDADGANLTRLTDRPTWDYNPAWSPDGNKIIFDSSYFGAEARSADESEVGIFVVDADGSNLQRVDALIPGDHEARWSPDGREILFVSDRGDLWPVAGPRQGRPKPIILRAGDGEQEGGSGSFCEQKGTRFHAIDVLGVWLPPEPLVAEAGARIAFDFSALPELTAIEVTIYDYEEARRTGRILEGAIVPPCAPPGGTESACLVQRITGPAEDLDLAPGHYAIIVRANFEGDARHGYTEQGFNLVVE